MRNYIVFSNRFGLQSRPLKRPQKYACRIARVAVPNRNEQLGITEVNGLFEELEKQEGINYTLHYCCC